jgi:hypothetical protein
LQLHANPEEAKPEADDDFQNQGVNPGPPAKLGEAIPFQRIAG